MHVTLCTMQMCCTTCGDLDRRCAQPGRTLHILACLGVVISFLQHLSLLVLLETVHQAAKAQQIRATDLHDQQC